MRSQSEITTFKRYGITVILIVILSLICLPLEGEMKQMMLSEEGVVEIGSALGYLVCFLFMVFVGKGPYVRKYPYLLVLVAACFFRELDFDKRFTTFGVLQTKFYAASNVPMYEKAIGLLVVLLILGAIVWALKRHTVELIKGFFKGDVIAVGFAIAAFFLVFSKTFDGFARKAKGFGVEVSSELNTQLSVIEEVMELGIPIIVMIMLLHVTKATTRRV